MNRSIDKAYLINRFGLLLLLIFNFNETIANEQKPLIYSSAALLSKEVIRHEMEPLTNYLIERGQPVNMVFPKNVEQFFYWADQRKFDFVVADPGHAYILKKYFDYLPIMESAETIDYLLASNLSNSDLTGKFDKALVMSNDLLSPYFVKKLVPEGKFEYHSNIENLLISLVKQPQSISVLDGDDALLLPPVLRNKIRLGEKKPFGRLVIMCNPNSPMDCKSLTREILELTQNWSDPDKKYIFMNLYHFRECCENEYILSEPLRLYLDSIMRDEYSKLLTDFSE